MFFSIDHLAPSLIARSAVTRIVCVAAGILLLWCAIFWAVSLA